MQPFYVLTKRGAFGVDAIDAETLGAMAKRFPPLNEGRDRANAVRYVQDSRGKDYPREHRLVAAALSRLVPPVSRNLDFYKACLHAGARIIAEVPAVAEGLSGVCANRILCDYRTGEPIRNLTVDEARRLPPRDPHTGAFDGGLLCDAFRGRTLFVEE